MRNSYNNILMLLILLFIPQGVKPQDASFEIPKEIIQILEAKNSTSHKSNYSFPTKYSGEIIASNITSNSGKHFFDFFSQINKFEVTTYTSDVIISENFAENGHYAEISVHFDDNLIYSFRALAKKDYLYAAAQESVKRLKMFYIHTSGGI